MKRAHSARRIIIYGAFVLSALSTAASGTIAFKKAPLVDRLRTTLAETTDALGQLESTAASELNFCIKYEGSIKSCLSKNEENHDLNAARLEQEQLSFALDKANTSFRGYLNLFISSGILTFLFGALSLAALAFSRKRMQECNTEKPVTELEDTVHTRKGE